MFCKKCGSYINDSAQFCGNCGAVQRDNMPLKPVGFLEAIKLYFTRYADFSGRSRRSEFWWAELALWIASLVITPILGDFSWILSLITLVPTLAICVRRLHDVGKSGWWYLLNLIPLVGQIILLVWYCKDSTPDNQWGPDPKSYRPR